MTVPRSVAEVISRHVLWELESIDRMYLNVYVPTLQCEQGVVRFFRYHRGQPFASSALMDPISKRFLAAIHTFATTHGIPLITFAPGQRKEDVAAECRARFPREEGVLFMRWRPRADSDEAERLVRRKANTQSERSRAPCTSEGDQSL